MKNAYYYAREASDSDEKGQTNNQYSGDKLFINIYIYVTSEEIEGTKERALRCSFEERSRRE
jgi:hypothetical protein